MSGFQVIVNGKVVWESEEDSILVSDVSIHTGKGELAHIRPDNDITGVSLDITVRDLSETRYRDTDVILRDRAREEENKELSAERVAALEDNPNFDPDAPSSVPTPREPENFTVSTEVEAEDDDDDEETEL